MNNRYRNPRWVTKIVILEVIGSNPNGILEPELRAVLKEQFGIDASTGIKNHLKNLENCTLIIKESYSGYANRWKINPAGIHCIKGKYIEKKFELEKYRHLLELYAKIQPEVVNDCS